MADARQKQWIGLIRGIGASTHKKMSMQQLREACNDVGLSQVSTLLATGNLLFKSSAAKKSLENTLQDVLAEFGLDNPVIIRQPADLQSVVAVNPFAEAARVRPNHLLVLFLTRKPGLTQIKNLLTYAGPEAIASGKQELYLDYVEGVGGSKLTPALLERRLEQAGTARNWNTINKLIAAAQAL